MTQMLTKKMFYFIPDVASDDLVIKQDYVIATEYDPKDITFKVRFLNGNAVQMFAVGETKEEVEEAFKKFQGYRKKYWEAVEKIKPAEEELHKAYEEAYGEFISKEMLQIINDRHNVNKVVAEAEKPANEDATR